MQWHLSFFQFQFRCFSIYFHQTNLLLFANRVKSLNLQYIILEIQHYLTRLDGDGETHNETYKHPLNSIEISIRIEPLINCIISLVRQSQSKQKLGKLDKHE